MREIARRLERRAEAVARALLPRGQVSKCKGFWEVGSGQGKSLKVHISGDRVGKWADFAIDGKSGDMLDLIQEVEGLSKFDAIQWAKRYLGIESGPPPSPADRAARDRRRAEQEAAEAEEAARRAAEVEQSKLSKQERALALWRSAESATKSPVELYYRARGIPGAPPKTIRYLRRCYHAPSGLWLPAAIAAVQGPDRLDKDGKMRGPIVAVHRTFLDLTRPRKADVEPNKMMLGEVSNGCVRLTAAASKMILCEGIETGLSIKARSLSAVWCALSVGGMVRAWIPDHVTDLTLAVDGDRVASSAWMEARLAAVERHRRPGRVIRIHEPPPGMDWNDVAQQRAGGLK